MKKTLFYLRMYFKFFANTFKQKSIRDFENYMIKSEIKMAKEENYQFIDKFGRIDLSES